MRKPLTLVFIFDDKERVLLGMKKRGFGAGRWNGFGGKLHEGESFEAAAKRELNEEVGIEARDLVEQGILEFEFEKERGTILETHVFRASSFEGTPTESEEMRPQWFATHSLPFLEMWPDDPLWFPLLLSGKKFRGSFLFGEGDAVLKAQVMEVSR